eukprot:c5207_g1_i2.p2 GENE.c5207_g1_i2~~c5207_g1_i2.p2  ORF type:complete len:186 (-),score=52.77 c5207_g1_i2:302-859(-)
MVLILDRFLRELDRMVRSPQFMKQFAFINQNNNAGGKFLGLYVVTVGVVGEQMHVPNPSHSKNHHLDAITQVQEDVAQQFNQQQQQQAEGDVVSFASVNARKRITDYEDEHNPGDVGLGLLTVDRVHPNSRGRRLMSDLHAHGILKVLLAHLGPNAPFQLVDEEEDSADGEGGAAGGVPGDSQTV